MFAAPPEDYVHTRADYDFEYADPVTHKANGKFGPIVTPAIVNPAIWLDIPETHWCKQHGWEKTSDYPYPNEEV